MNFFWKVWHEVVDKLISNSVIFLNPPGTILFTNLGHLIFIPLSWILVFCDCYNTLPYLVTKQYTFINFQSNCLDFWRSKSKNDLAGLKSRWGRAAFSLEVLGGHVFLAFSNLPTLLDSSPHLQSLQWPISKFSHSCVILTLNILPSFLFKDLVIKWANLDVGIICLFKGQLINTLIPSIQ